MTAEHLTKSAQLDEQLLQDAAGWFVVIEQGAAVERQLDEFGDWLLADPSHGLAYDQIERAWGLAAHISLDARHDSAGQKTPLSLKMPWFASQGWPLPVWLGGGALATVCALCVLLLVGPGTRPADDTVPVRYQTGIGEIRDFTLADGSEVILGPDSILDVRLSERARAVSLRRGDALFEVVNRSQLPDFVVDAGSMRVRVTGTRFDVQRRTNFAKVAVAEGQVEVSRQNTGGTREPAAIKLTLGEEVVVSDEAGWGSVKQVRPEHVGLWPSRRLIYDDVPLSVMVSDLQRYARIRIRIEDVAARSMRVSGRFSTEDIPGVLTTLTEILPLTLARDPDESYVLTAK